MKNARIVSFGSYIPPKVVTNKDLEQMLNTTDEWIQQRSGIKERHWVEAGVDTTLTMAKKACEDALKKGNLKADDVDFIIFGCLLSDYVFPGTGCLLQQALGFSKPVRLWIFAINARDFFMGLALPMPLFAREFIKK